MLSRNSYLILCLLIISCGNKKEKMLFGKWQLVDRQIVCNNPRQDSIEDQSRHEKDLPIVSLAEESANAINKGESYTFKKDRKYIENYGSAVMDGNYSIKDSGIILTGMMNIVTQIFTFKNITDSTLAVEWGIKMRGHTHTYNDRFIKVTE
jgi:hypothetical protein